MISVIMGVSSLDCYLDFSIKSILNQTYHDFEFIIIANGASATQIVDYIESNFKDPRITVIQSKIPQLAYALNLGLDRARYEFIARMDADDVAEPDRLERQLEFLNQNGLDLVGTAVTLIDHSGEVIGCRTPKRRSDINFWLDYKCCFIHPSVMYKKEVVLRARGYNAGFNSEDYDLWLRMRRMNVRWDNMPDKLLRYRVHHFASQRRLLGYAEVAGYTLREFLLERRFKKFIAVIFNSIKALIRSR